MPDPRNELVDIIAPAVPDAVASAVGGNLLVWGAVAGGALAGFALLAWLWHRRQPVRALRAIAAGAARREGAVPVLAARLDAWARMAFKQARVDARRCPAGIDPAAWSDWAKGLEALRFAPSPPDGYGVLVRLCASARAWKRDV